MSQQYDDYLFEHRYNLKLGLDWFKTYMPELFDSLGGDVDIEQQVVFAHDASKDGQDEYDAYDAYWYGKNRSFKVVEEYNYAWLHHKHNNPHHWQYWVLFNDESEEGLTILEMPMNYIIELLCDWWSFGWKEEDLYSTHKWYAERKDYIKFHPKTRKIVEGILAKMKEILDSMIKPEV